MDFTRITEEEAGFRTGTSEELIKRVIGHGCNLHSVLLLRHGKLFYENYSLECGVDFKHRMYSVSKTFVSAAVGCAIGEGLIALDTHVVDYFKDKAKGEIHPYLAALTVKDCLIMATPFSITPYDHTHDDWLYDFFNAPCTHRPGTLFQYDTGASLVLSALVERVTGLTFNVYLYEKCLKYIGFTAAPECVESPEGTKWGGSGIFCTAREFAAFAAMWMRGGKAEDGTQLIPESYIKLATSKQNGNQETNVRNSLRGYGYGFQTWMIKHGWAMFGMGNQLAFCYPEEDLLFICTGDDQGNDFARTYIIDAIEEILLPQLGFTDTTPPSADLTMPLPFGEKHSPTEETVSGTLYNMEPSKLGIENISFTFCGDEGEMKFTARGEEKTIRFGMNKYVEGVFPETLYSGLRINTPLERGYRCFAAAAWDMPDLLVLRLYASDLYFGVLTANIRFSESTIDIRFTKRAEWFFEEYNDFATGHLIP